MKNLRKFNMARNINQSTRLLAGMLAALSTGEPYHLPSIQIPRESNSILEGIEAKAEERRIAAEQETIAKARAKQARKNLKKGIDSR